MRILKIERKQKTSHDTYVEITFKPFFGKPFKERCIKTVGVSFVFYAKDGLNLPTQFNKVIESFLRTEDDVHEY